MSFNALSPYKPSDKVRAFLDKKENEGELKPGARLPTSDELALQLQVSSGTVKNVYRALAQEGRVKTQIGVGSFWLGKEKASSRRYRIGFNLNLSDTAASDWWTRSVWAGQIFGGILKKKLNCSLDLSLETCGDVGEEAGEEGRKRLNGLDGMIALSLKPLPGKLYDGTGREVVYVSLNPPADQQCVNFVSPDYFSCSRALGETWRLTGRRRILLMTGAPLAHSVSSRLRFAGLLCGIGEAIGSEVEVRSINVGSSGCEGGEEGVRRILDSGWTPDAIYCAGGHLARGAVQALEKKGFSIPDEISVMGGSRPEMSTTALLPLSTMLHPLERVGVLLLEMLLRRIDSHGEDVPGRVEPVPFLIGSTTRPAENEHLLRHSRAVLAAAEN